MDSIALVAFLQEAVPGASFEAVPSRDRHATVDVPASALAASLLALRDGPALRFDVLADIAAVDFWPREPRFELSYLLVSTGLRLRARIKVRLPGAAVRVPTATGVWPAAGWLEREVWDLFGIEFDGHPDLRRLLMPDDWEGHPLRKDYPVQINMPAKTASPLRMTADEFRRNVERDRGVR